MSINMWYGGPSCVLYWKNSADEVCGVSLIFISCGSFGLTFGGARSFALSRESVGFIIRLSCAFLCFEFTLHCFFPFGSKQKYGFLRLESFRSDTYLEKNSTNIFWFWIFLPFLSHVKLWQEDCEMIILYSPQFANKFLNNE